MACNRPEYDRPWRFDPRDMAVMAGWLAGAARRGYDAVLGVCDDGTEWVGVAPPQLQPGGLWQIIPTPRESGFVVLDQHGQPCFHSPGIRAVLHFVAPLPPGTPEPQLIHGGRVPSVLAGGDLDPDWPDGTLDGEATAPCRPTLH